MCNYKNAVLIQKLLFEKAAKYLVNKGKIKNYHQLIQALFGKVNHNKMIDFDCNF